MSNRKNRRGGKNISTPISVLLISSLKYSMETSAQFQTVACPEFSI